MPKVKNLRLRWIAIVGVFIIAGGLPALVSAQSVSPNDAPSNSAEKAGTVGHHDYVAPDTVYVPNSSIEHPGDAGVFAHTNYVLRTTNGAAPQAMAQIDPALTEAETPASLGCVYKVGPVYPGCNPATGGTRHPGGGWGAIALVDAYDNPYAGRDIHRFSRHFGLPAPNFTKIYATGNGSCSTVPPNKDWALEESLDIEWAHAMAPNAKIILVEACSTSVADLVYAEQVAADQVASAGGGAVSNSWSTSEFSGETSYDQYFKKSQYPNSSKITFLASAGDHGCGANWPSSSPWVVSAGGTTVRRDYLGNFKKEACWSGSGGGTSTYETWSDTWTGGGNMGPWAAFQYSLFGKASRATPDMSFDADPASGVYVLSKYNGGWFIVGGTSVSSPALAGIIDHARNKLGEDFHSPNSGAYFYNEEDTLLYSQLPAVKEYKKNFYDVTVGSNGCPVDVNWDYCTGVGSPRGLRGK